MNKNLTQFDFDIPLSIFAKPTGNSDFDVPIIKSIFYGGEARRF